MTWFSFLILGVSVALIAVILVAPSQRYRLVRFRRNLRRPDR